MILYRLQGESVDLWFPTDHAARAQGQRLWPILCSVKAVKLPLSKQAMSEFLNHIGGSAP